MGSPTANSTGRGCIGIGGRFGEGDDDVVLDHVGVLELVDAQVGDLGAQAGEDARVLREQPAGQHEDVVERHVAGLVPLASLVEHQRHQDAKHADQHVVVNGADCLGDLLLDLVAERLGVGAAEVAPLDLGHQVECLGHRGRRGELLDLRHELADALAQLARARRDRLRAG